MQQCEPIRRELVEIRPHVMGLAGAPYVKGAHIHADVSLAVDCAAGHIILRLARSRNAGGAYMQEFDNIKTAGAAASWLLYTLVLEGPTSYSGFLPLSYQEAKRLSVADVL